LGRRTFTAEQIVTMLREARVLIESWRREYNHIRPHSSLGCRPPEHEALQPGSIAAGSTVRWYNSREFGT
jgi:hypothetical protein